jgi:hypothetical protein
VSCEIAVRADIHSVSVRMYETWKTSDLASVIMKEWKAFGGNQGLKYAP